MRPPKRLWVIVDLDPESEYVTAEFTTREAAREQCRRLNGLRGYEPTCRVVKYERSTFTKSSTNNKEKQP